jgi:transposase
MGRKTLQIKGYSSEQIKSFFNNDEKYTIGLRLYAVYQVSIGQSTRKLELLYNTSFKQICNWVHRFEESGIEGLKDKPKSGRKSRLSKENMASLNFVLLNNRPDEYGYNTATWNGPIIQEYIKKHFNVVYKKAQIYNLLKQLGFTFQKGRATYPEADYEKRETFKETIKKTSRRTK